MDSTDPQTPTPTPVPPPPPRRKLTWQGAVGLLAVPVCALLAGMWGLQWFSTPRYGGDTLPGWRDKLRAPGLETRKQALAAIGKLPANDEETIAQLAALVLEEDDAETRAEAIRLLDAILLTARADRTGTLSGVRRRTLENYLVVGREDQAEDRAPARSRRASEALVVLSGLTQTSEHADEVSPRVLALLLDRVAVKVDPERAALLAVLAKVPQMPAEAEPLLLMAAAKQSLEGRLAVARCLVKLPALTPKAVPILVESLTDSELSGRAQEHLVQLGPASVRSLVPLLDGDEAGARAASNALVRIGAPALPDLRRAVLAGDFTRRERMAELLSRFGNDGFAILVPLLRPDDPESVKIAQAAFLKANSRAYLLTQREHPDAVLRAAIEELLKQFPEKEELRPK